MFAIALFSVVLSVPSLAWNFTMVKSAKRRMDVLPFVISALTLVFGIGYMVFALVNRFHSVGVVLF